MTQPRDGKRVPCHRGVQRRLGPLVSLLFVLTGCAALSAHRDPADFPLHTTSEFVVLHWQLDRTSARVAATGVVEVQVRPPNRLREVTVELRGVDAAGRVVSRGGRLASPMAFDAGVPWPFTVRLYPTGEETRFELAVAGVTWREHLGNER